MTADSGKRNLPAVNRKISKGVIERKRRARINRSLSELKFIILSDSKDKGLHSKLDKAEILERTLAYIQSLQSRETCSTTMDRGLPLTKYRDGFFGCISEIDRFLTVEKVDEKTKQKITAYLSFCLNGLHQAAPLQSRVLPEIYYMKSISPVPQYTMVPGSPSPSNSSTASGYSSSCDTPSSVKSESVWRPW